MTAIAYFIVSCALGFLFYPSLAGLLSASGSLRQNYRGREVICGSGLLVVLVWLVVAGVSSLLGLQSEALLGQEGIRLSVLVLGVALFGLLDDLLGDRRVVGFRGHFAELFKGRPTTGALKAVGIGLLAVAVAAGFSAGPLHVLLNALIIALSVNSFNLFDLRPGRALKVFFLSGILVSVLAGNVSRQQIAVFLGAAAALIIPDLKERSMLGDVGSNALGAVIGYEIVVNFVPAVRLAALLLLLVFQVYADRRSLTDLISRVGILRRLDELGRKPAG